MVVSTVLERNPEVIISGSLDLDEVGSIHVVVLLYNSLLWYSWIMYSGLYVIRDYLIAKVNSFPI